MVFVVDVEEVKENQDALEGLLRYAGVPEKWIRITMTAYTAKTTCSKEQKELFDRVFNHTKR